MDCRPPGFSVHGISQARTPEWVAIPFSKGSSWPRDQTQVCYIASRFFAIWVTRGFLGEKNGDKEISGTGMWIDLQKCAEDLKMWVSHKAFGKCSPTWHQQRTILIIKTVGSPYFGYQSDSFPGHLVIAQWAHDKVAMVARVKVMPGLINMGFYSPRQTWLWPTLSAQSSSSRDQHWVLNKTLFLGVISQPHGSRVIIQDHFHLGRGDILFLVEYTLTVNMNLPPLHITHIIFHGLSECLFTVMVFHTAFRLIEELTS